MEGSQQAAQGSIPFDVVGEMMFDGSLSEEEHVAVITSVLGEQPSPKHCGVGLEYAREHIQDPVLLAKTELVIGEKAMHKGLGQTTGNNTFGYPFREQNLINNSDIADIAVSGAAAVFELGDRADSYIFSRAFKLLRQVQQRNVADFALEPLHTDRFRRVHGLALSFIKKAGSRGTLLFPEKDILGATPHEAYKEQLTWVNAQRNMSRDIDGAALDKATARLHSRVIDTLDPSPLDLEDCLALAKDFQVPKGEVIAKAIEITSTASHEPRVQVTRSALGFKRKETHPSPFEVCREQLGEYIGEDISSHVAADYRGLIAEVAELGDERDQAWNRLAERLAGHAFDGSRSYSLRSIEDMPVLFEKFAEIAPPEAVNHGRAMLKSWMLQTHSDPHR